MRNRSWIAGALLLFLALFAVPFWYGLPHARKGLQGPNLQLPVDRKECVAPIAYMRSSHMRLLIDWRESAVRQGNRTYISFDHKEYRKSLTRTCWQCHDRAAFCDRCHTYSGVSTPYCWNCHNQPQTNVAWRAGQ